MSPVCRFIPPSPFTPGARAPPPPRGRGRGVGLLLSPKESGPGSAKPGCASGGCPLLTPLLPDSPAWILASFHPSKQLRGRSEFSSLPCRVGSLPGSQPPASHHLCASEARAPDPWGLHQGLVPRVQRLEPADEPPRRPRLVDQLLGIIARLPVLGGWVQRSMNVGGCVMLSEKDGHKKECFL